VPRPRRDPRVALAREIQCLLREEEKLRARREATEAALQVLTERLPQEQPQPA
jgi:hypothetical protein